MSRPIIPPALTLERSPKLLLGERPAKFSKYFESGMGQSDVCLGLPSRLVRPRAHGIGRESPVLFGPRGCRSLAGEDAQRRLVEFRAPQTGVGLTEFCLDRREAPPLLGRALVAKRVLWPWARIAEFHRWVVDEHGPCLSFRLREGETTCPRVYQLYGRLSTCYII